MVQEISEGVDRKIISNEVVRQMAVDCHHQRVQAQPPTQPALHTSPGRKMEFSGRFLKCNLDAAVFEGEGSISCGMVVRDGEGRVVFARTFKIHGIQLLQWKLSFREALSWLHERRFSMVLFETDSQLLENVCNRVLKFLVQTSYLGLVVQDCKILLEACPLSSVRFMRRSANLVAHKLARVARCSLISESGPSTPSFSCGFLDAVFSKIFLFFSIKKRGEKE